jgi:Fic family protein
MGRRRRLLDTWLADESGYDERVWPQLKKAIEENRLSSWKRFDD